MKVSRPKLALTAHAATNSRSAIDIMDRWSNTVRTKCSDGDGGCCCAWEEEGRRTKQACVDVYLSFRRSHSKKWVPRVQLDTGTMKPLNGYRISRRTWAPPKQTLAPKISPTCVSQSTNSVTSSIATRFRVLLLAQRHCPKFFMRATTPCNVQHTCGAN